MFGMHHVASFTEGIDFKIFVDKFVALATKCDT